MLDSEVGRTKRSAVPAIVRHLPERRCAWSGLQTLDGSGGRGWTERSEGSPGVSGLPPSNPGHPSINRLG